MSSLTRDELVAWKENPMQVDHEAHEEACSDGFVYLNDGSAARCPVCDWQRHREKLLVEMERAGISRRYLLTEWSKLEMTPMFSRLKEAVAKIGEVLESGMSAVFTGPPGTGKSTAAALMARAAIERGHTAHMANIGRISALVRSGYDGDGDGWTEAGAIEWLATPDLLVLDDLGAGETREGSHELKLLYLALEQRQANGLIAVVTTNLSEDALRDRLGERVMNRLMPYKVFRFGGKNYRRHRAASWPGLE